MKILKSNFIFGLINFICLFILPLYLFFLILQLHLKFYSFSFFQDAEVKG